MDVFCIAAGAMISSGLFVLPGIAYSKTGPAMVYSYIIAGLLVIPSMLAKAELSTAMPRAGGDYFFIERSMGPAAGTLGGIAAWFSLSFKSAFALLGIGIFTRLLNPGLTGVHMKMIAVGFCIVFMFVNLIGVKETGRTQILVVLSLIAILGLYIVAGAFFVRSPRYIPFMPFGIGSVFATAGLVFVSYGGLTKVASVAEEVRNPGRNIPMGMFLAFAIVLLLYALVAFITVGLVDSVALRDSLTPISLGAASFMGRIGIFITAIAALLAFISTANAGILSASRNPMAMSRDQLLPDFAGRISSRFRTPHISIILTTTFMIAVILFLDLENLVKTASTLKILLFMGVNLSLLIMRESKIQNYQPKYRAPLYPWIQVFGIIGYGFLIYKIGTTPLLITSAFIVAGLLWYLVYVRKRVEREFAFIHVVERATAKELTSYSLETELKEILRERDDIIEDRFDRIISESKVLDIEESLNTRQLFGKVAASLGPELGIEEEEVLRLFLQREEESSTVIRPGFAIPHVIVEGEHQFKILLIRCREGVLFSDTLPKVHVIFALAVSRDERNFYLRALSAIAQIAQETGFDKKWLGARRPEEMRDIVLLGKRRRYTSA